MKKKLFIAILLLIFFLLFNYALALFNPQALEFPEPVWMNQASEQTETVKQLYLESLSPIERILIITIDVDGTDITGLVTSSGRSEEEQKKILSEVGECEFLGKTGHWQFRVDSFTFLNIRIGDHTELSCNYGLSDL